MQEKDFANEFALKRILTNFLILLSFVFLILGICKPILSIKLSSHIDAQISQVNIVALDKTQSILETVADLWKHNNRFVAMMVFFFSVLIPIFKGLISLWLTNNRSHSSRRNQIYRLLHHVSKWSMADVFIVAIFLAYLSTQANPQITSTQIAALGFSLKVTFKTILQSTVGHGFYYFLTYCLLSMVSTTMAGLLLKPKPNDRSQANNIS